MKIHLLILSAAGTAILAGCGNGNSGSPADIIPLPLSISVGDGTWTPGQNTTLAIEGVTREDSLRIATRLNSYLPVPAISSKGSEVDISLSCEQSSTAQEGYLLTVGSDGVKAVASDPAGLFYSIITLGEMMSAGDGSVTVATITDEPRFGYRGMMLDVSRNFRDTAFVRKQIDAMARMKLNHLHLHLTDGAGWRMEIKSYPELTRKAAWRVGETWKDWNANGNRYSEEGAPDASGGYYTQEELRDLVAYAADRYITIVPEIEMPSHSEEVISAYPELGCSHGNSTSDFCPSNKLTYEFIYNVLDEVMDVFPSKMIHIGGDEAPKTAWRTCDRCAATMRKEHIENIDGLQSYMIHQVERYLNDKGRDMLGWDEIMEGGLAPNATVMSWRGTEGGERAAAAGHRVIMTPGRYCYFDGYQDAPSTQPEAIGGYLPLNLAYSYNPTEGLSDSAAVNIFGLQGNLFSEYIPTAEHAEYMLYPRMYAIAERGWSQADVTDIADFRRRVSRLAADMRAHGYNTFDIDHETGNRPEASGEEHHLAYGCPIDFKLRPWRAYPANGDSTLTDGKRGGWNYNDRRWQGFIGRGTERIDLVIDLGEIKNIHEIGADFMQICGPDVYMPARVIISAGETSDNLQHLATIDHTVVRDSVVSFKRFGWDGETKARYIRYQATADSLAGGVLFTDEIIVR